MKSEQFKIIEDKSFATGQGECFALGSKIEIKDIVFTSGGGGTNTAVTFARQGLKTVCMGAIADDFNGEAIIGELKQEGVNADYFQINKGGHTAYSVILVHESGERTILSYKGEGQNFDVNKISFNKLTANWLFLDSLGGHYDLLESAVEWAVKNDVKLAANPGGKELLHGLDKLKPLFKNFSIVIINKEEAANLTGISYENESEIFKMMDSIINGIFVMTKGPEGVVASDGKNIYRAGVPDSPIVERTGAGDAFSAGFVSEILKATSDKADVRSRLSDRKRRSQQPTSDDIVKAIQFATANASSVVAQYGAKAGILKKGDWGLWELVKVEQIQL